MYQADNDVKQHTQAVKFKISFIIDGKYLKTQK